MILDVPYIDQSNGYPTGCESITAVMALRYAGIPVTPDAFVDSFLPSAGFAEENGVLTGPDPNRFFVGSPRDPESFGCYAPVIKSAVEAVLASPAYAGSVPPGLFCEDLTGLSTDELIERYISKGIPVLYWASIDLLEPYKGPSWVLPDGRPFTWLSNEHCMLLTGYGEGTLIFHDPWNNNGIRAYDRALAEKRHEAFFSMALAIHR